MPFIKILLITLVYCSSFIHASDESDEYVPPYAKDQQLFFEAVQKGDIPQARKHLEAQRGVDSAYIVNRHNPLPIDELLKKYPGQDILTNTDGSIYNTSVYPDFPNKADHCKTGLMYAVSNRDIEMIKFLLNYGADVNKESGNIKHPLNPISAKHKIVYLQGSYRAFQPTITPFSCAIWNDYVDVVNIFTQYLYYNLHEDYRLRPDLSWNHGKYLQILDTYYNLAKIINRTNIIEFFENTGYIISDLDKQVGKLTKNKIDLYQKAFPSITQDKVFPSITQDLIDETITRRNIPNLYRYLYYNRSFILYLKEYTDITFTIDHIDTILVWYLEYKTLDDPIDVDNIRFIMDLYNISADVPQLEVINILLAKSSRDRSQSTEPIKDQKLLKMLFDRGFNPNNIELREPAEFILFYGDIYHSGFENYVFKQQKVYNKKQQLKEKEIKKAELKAQKEIEKAEKLAEKERKRLEKATKKTTKPLDSAG